MRKTLATLVATLVVGLVAGPAVAQQTDRQQTDRGADVDVQAGETRVQVDVDRQRRGGLAYRSSDLEGLDVRNAEGEELGNIEDLVVDAQRGRVRYLALSVGGFLGVGDKLVAIPWGAFQVQRQEDETYLRLDVSKQILEDAPGFENDNWPSFADQQWVRTNEQFYREEGVTGQRQREGAQERQRTPDRRERAEGTQGRQRQPEGQQRRGEFAYRASDLEGLAVRNAEGEDLGDIEDLVIDMQSGRVRYAALSVGGFLGVDEKLIAAPWDAFQVQRQEDETYLLLDVSKQILEDAPGFESDNWPSFADQQWVRTNEQFYRQAGVTERRQRQPDRQARRDRGGLAYRSSDLEGLEVRNAQGEDLGDIEDLVIDMQSGRVRYAALSVGGFLGVGDKMVAIPWDAFQLQRQEDETFLLLDVSREMLEEDPGFDNESWPESADQKWVRTSEQVDRDADVNTQRPRAETRDRQPQPDNR